MLVVCARRGHENPTVGLKPCIHPSTVLEAGDPGSPCCQVLLADGRLPCVLTGRRGLFYRDTDLFPRAPRSCPEHLQRPRTITLGMGFNRKLVLGTADTRSTAGTSISRLCSCPWEDDSL